MSNVISIYARALRCQHNRSDIFCPILKSFEHMFAVARPMAQIRRDYSLCLLKQFTRVRCHIHRYLKCRKNLLPLFIRCVRKSTRFMGVKGFERERERERNGVCMFAFVCACNKMRKLVCSVTRCWNKKWPNQFKRKPKRSHSSCNLSLSRGPRKLLNIGAILIPGHCLCEREVKK